MNPEFEKHLKDTIQLLVQPIAGEHNLNITKEADQWRVVVESEKDQNLIGDNGEVLHAMQHLVRVLVHKKFPDDRTHFLIDIGKYKQERENLLKANISTIAQSKVLNEGYTVILVNLSSYERKIVHSLLKEIEGLETTSVGPEESRKLILRPTTEVGSSGMENAIVINLFENNNSDTK